MYASGPCYTVLIYFPANISGQDSSKKNLCLERIFGLIFSINVKLYIFECSKYFSLMVDKFQAYMSEKFIVTRFFCLFLATINSWNGCLL